MFWGIFLLVISVFGHNFTCKTIAMIQQALGEKIVEVKECFLVGMFVILSTILRKKFRI